MPSPRTLASLAAFVLSLAACADRVEPCVPATPSREVFYLHPPIQPLESVDILFTIDNSGSMAQNQLHVTNALGPFLDGLVNPPLDPATNRPRYRSIRSLHVGVISTDLGTPGAVVPGCANSDGGDDGLLNPTRNGLATRTHQPWETAPPGVRPARCTTDANQYPIFLRFDAMQINPNDPMQTYVRNFRDDFVCNAYLSTGGCGIEQPLEAMYRALITHDARATPGNMSPNAGFLRDSALLALVVVTDEEDGSVRDARYAEPGLPTRDATSVFDSLSPGWASNDLNLRFYLYSVGSAQDPTWPLDRYIDPQNPARGFTSLKPGRPERDLYHPITGVPIELPTTRDALGEETADWIALLGTNPDGSNGYAAMSAEGPVSMRPHDMDPRCSTRVVPACRREGSSHNPAACDANTQYFAWPARRIAEVARRFDETWHSGSVSSICRNNYEDAFSRLRERIGRLTLDTLCIPARLDTTPPICSPTRTTACVTPAQNIPVRVNCIVREVLPTGVSAATTCTAASGRTPGARDPQTQRETCLIRQIPVVPGSVPARGVEGFFYDTRLLREDGCMQRITFTPGVTITPGAWTTTLCSWTPGFADHAC